MNMIATIKQNILIIILLLCIGLPILESSGLFSEYLQLYTCSLVEIELDKEEKEELEEKEKKEVYLNISGKYLLGYLSILSHQKVCLFKARNVYIDVPYPPPRIA